MRKRRIRIKDWKAENKAFYSFFEHIYWSYYVPSIVLSRNIIGKRQTTYLSFIPHTWGLITWNICSSITPAQTGLLLQLSRALACTSFMLQALEPTVFPSVSPPLLFTSLCAHYVVLVFRNILAKSSTPLPLWHSAVYTANSNPVSAWHAAYQTLLQKVPWLFYQFIVFLIQLNLLISQQVFYVS